jgi:hypothetical protein
MVAAGRAMTGGHGWFLGREAFRLAREVGIKVAAGTDCGAVGHPHGTLAEELSSIIEAGATPKCGWCCVMERKGTRPSETGDADEGHDRRRDTRTDP